MTDEFIEYCAHEYFNGYAACGLPNHLKYTFEQFVEIKKGMI